MKKKIFLICLVLVSSLVFISVNAKKYNIFELFEKKAECTKAYIPVCSKTAKTFDNVCLLEESEEELDYYGRCIEYPYNLSVDKCIEEGFSWDGYRCYEKDKEGIIYEGDGFEIMLPANSIIYDDFIELPKESNKSNLIFKKLEFVSENYIEDILDYTKVNSREDNLIKGETSLDYGDEVLADIDYEYYIFEDKIGVLFSLYSNGKYNEKIETSSFSSIFDSLVLVERSEELLSPCEEYGDLNSDGILSKDDLNYFIFGTVENNMQKRGDLNGDNVVDEKDENILYSFLNKDIHTFPVCLDQKIIKKGSVPKISFNNNFTVKQNAQKTETKVIFNFDVIASEGDVYIGANSFNIKNDFIEDLTWSTGAEIKEEGYIFIEKGKTTWVSVEIDLKAKKNPSYAKVSIDEINYLNEKGEVEKLETKISTNDIYLNYIKEEGNLICENFGDVNGDDIIDEKDIALILYEDELSDEQKLRADVNLDGEVNILDAVEIKKYLLRGEVLPVCFKTFPPRIYDNSLIGVISNEDYSKHITITFYLDSNLGDAFIPAKVSFNQDDETAGIFIELEKDGAVAFKNIELWSSAELNKEGFLRIKKGVPNWIKIELDVYAIKDTALLNFRINKIGYLDGYIYPLNIETGDMFLNFEEEPLCNKLGDLNLDGRITYTDYDYLKNNLNIILKNPELFERADLNGDGKIDKLDLKELDDYLNQRIKTFSGSSKKACSLEVEPVYTKDGLIYANECYLSNTQEIKCYINKDCNL